MLFVNKQKEIQSQISEYCESILKCMDSFENAVKHYCADSNRDAVKASFTEVHKAESRADDIRREIEVLMYSKSLFPESRGDIMGLLETMDRVPNQAEEAIRMIWNQYVVVPQKHIAEILTLVDVCCRSASAMVEAAEKLFADFTNAAVAVGKIDELESEGDKIEASLIEKVFSEKPDSVAAIVFRDFIESVAGISDRAENVGDRIRIIVAKRTI